MGEETTDVPLVSNTGRNHDTEEAFGSIWFWTSVTKGTVPALFHSSTHPRGLKQSHIVSAERPATTNQNLHRETSQIGK